MELRRARQAVPRGTLPGLQFSKGAGSPAQVCFIAATLPIGPTGFCRFGFSPINLRLPGPRLGVRGPVGLRVNNCTDVVQPGTLWCAVDSQGWLRVRHLTEKPFNWANFDALSYHDIDLCLFGRNISENIAERALGFFARIARL
mmetsp:Transcript_8125/g.18187  ORF Transcript_8125/g.18187 Transcript_8125/m.18187 type:complete len:144 (-) Transcript_8125:36-467(-)